MWQFKGMLSRKLKISINNGFLLFGARGVGKSTLLKSMFAGIPIKFIDLLRLDVRNQLLDAPDSLEAMIPPNTE